MLCFFSRRWKRKRTKRRRPSLSKTYCTTYNWHSNVLYWFSNSDQKTVVTVADNFTVLLLHVNFNSDNFNRRTLRTFLTVFLVLPWLRILAFFTFVNFRLSRSKEDKNDLNAMLHSLKKEGLKIKETLKVSGQNDSS